MPKVSVILPAYNVQAYIDQSIPSVLAQTFQDFELIVVDDGSTDETRARARQHNDPRVRVVHQANRGLAGARNQGIRQAKGEYIAFLDADDLWREDKLAHHVQHLDDRPWVGVSYCQSAFIDDNGRSLNYLQCPKLEDVTPRDIFLRNPIGNGSAPVIRRATFREISYISSSVSLNHAEAWYFDETFRRSEDIECWMRIALNTNWQFEGIPEPLTFYRVNALGLSANLPAQMESWERMAAKVAAYDPEFAAENVDAARGYQLRYLARRAIRMGAPMVGLSLLQRSLRSHPAMLLDEPARTTATWAAALLCSWLPPNLYHGIEDVAMRLASLPNLPQDGIKS